MPIAASWQGPHSNGSTNKVENRARVVGVVKKLIFKGWDGVLDGHEGSRMMGFCALQALNGCFSWVIVVQVRADTEERPMMVLPDVHKTVPT